MIRRKSSIWLENTITLILDELIKIEFFLNTISDQIFEFENFQRIISLRTQSLGQFNWESFEAEKDLIIF
jgi:hypothetical protein